jgi:Protein of unknown function (DUF2911)
MTMKPFLAPLALLAMPFFAVAQELPAPSPSASVMQRIGLTDVSINYSRPSMKGRHIFGDLVPLGEVWRTGANQCTMLATTGTLVINGQKLPEGKYSVFTIPGDGVWQVIFNKNIELWGSTDRRPEEDVLTLKVASRPCQTTETFTIGFDNLGQDKADLFLRWEKQEAVVELIADATDQSLMNIKMEMSKPEADYSTYARSASFCLDRGIEPQTALGWAQKSVGMEKKYWNTFTLAKAQAANGMYKEASATCKEAVALAGMEKDASSQKSYQAKLEEWSAKASGK